MRDVCPPMNHPSTRFDAHKTSTRRPRTATRQPIPPSPLHTITPPLHHQTTPSLHHYPRHPSPSRKRDILRQLPQQHPRQHPRLHLQHAAVADPVPEHRVGHQRFHPPLVRGQEPPPPLRPQRHRRTAADEVRRR